jgi:hypothetical protein
MVQADTSLVNIRKKTPQGAMIPLGDRPRCRALFHLVTLDRPTRRCSILNMSAFGGKADIPSRLVDVR